VSIRACPARAHVLFNAPLPSEESGAPPARVRRSILFCCKSLVPRERLFTCVLPHWCGTLLRQRHHSPPHLTLARSGHPAARVLHRHRAAGAGRAAAHREVDLHGGAHVHLQVGLRRGRSHCLLPGVPELAPPPRGGAHPANVHTHTHTRTPTCTHTGTRTRTRTRMGNTGVLRNSWPWP